MTGDMWLWIALIFALHSFCFWSLLELSRRIEKIKPALQNKSVLELHSQKKLFLESLNAKLEERIKGVDRCSVFMAIFHFESESTLFEKIDEVERKRNAKAIHIKMMFDGAESNPAVQVVFATDMEQSEEKKS